MSALTILDLSEARRALVPTAHSPRPTAALEAASPILYGQGIGADAGWRPYSGRLSTRDLTPATQTRMQQVAYYLYVTNPLAQRLINIVVEFVTKGGITLKAEEPDVQAVLDEYWTINKRADKLPDELRALGIFGEHLAVLPRNEISGAVRRGYVDPQWIEAVDCATLQDLPGIAVVEPIAVALKRVDTQREGARIELIHRDEDPYSPSFGQLVGRGFYFSINSIPGGTRGISDLFAIADMADAHEGTLWALVNRADMAGRWIIDVLLRGMTEDQIREWLRKNGRPPVPGEVRAHNEQVTYTMPSYQVGATDCTETVRQVRVNVLGGRGIPEHWYASGSDANLATAAAQGDPIIAMLTARAKLVESMESQAGEFVIDSKVRAGVLRPGVNRKFAVQMPELSVKDLLKATTALAQIAAAVAGLQGAEVMDKRTAARAVAAVLPQIGVDGVDPDEMMAAAAAEAEANKAADYARGSYQPSAISPDLSGPNPAEPES